MEGENQRKGMVGTGSEVDGENNQQKMGPQGRGTCGRSHLPPLSPQPRGGSRPLILTSAYLRSRLQSLSRLPVTLGPGVSAPTPTRALAPTPTSTSTSTRNRSVRLKGEAKQTPSQGKGQAASASSLRPVVRRASATHTVSARRWSTSTRTTRYDHHHRSLPLQSDMNRFRLFRTGAPLTQTVEEVDSEREEEEEEEEEGNEEGEEFGEGAATTGEPGGAIAGGGRSTTLTPVIPSSRSIAGGRVARPTPSPGGSPYIYSSGEGREREEEEEEEEEKEKEKEKEHPFRERRSPASPPWVRVHTPAASRGAQGGKGPSEVSSPYTPTQRPPSYRRSPPLVRGAPQAKRARILPPAIPFPVHYPPASPSVGSGHITPRQRERVVLAPATPSPPVSPSRLASQGPVNTVILPSPSRPLRGGPEAAEEGGIAITTAPASPLRYPPRVATARVVAAPPYLGPALRPNLWATTAPSGRFPTIPLCASSEEVIEAFDRANGGAGTPWATDTFWPFDVVTIQYDYTRRDDTLGEPDPRTYVRYSQSGGFTVMDMAQLVASYYGGTLSPEEFEVLERRAMQEYQARGGVLGTTVPFDTFFDRAYSNGARFKYPLLHLSIERGFVRRCDMLPGSTFFDFELHQTVPGVLVPSIHIPGLL